jgi:hypothetical protein
MVIDDDDDDDDNNGDDNDDDDGDDNVCLAVNVIISRHTACVVFYDDEHDRHSDE